MKKILAQRRRFMKTLFSLEMEVKNPTYVWTPSLFFIPLFKKLWWKLMTRYERWLSRASEKNLFCYSMRKSIAVSEHYSTAMPYQEQAEYVYVKKSLASFLALVSPFCLISYPRPSFVRPFSHFPPTFALRKGLPGVSVGDGEGMEVKRVSLFFVKNGESAFKRETFFGHRI